MGNSLTLQIVNEAPNTRRETSRNALQTAASRTLAAMGCKCADGLFVNIAQRQAIDFQPRAKVDGGDKKTVD